MNSHNHLFKMAISIPLPVCILIVLGHCSSGEPDTPLTANAGPDHTCHILDTTTLDGGGSTAPDNTPLDYRWTQTAGPAVTLDSPNSPTPSFYAAKPGIVTFQLQVSDGQSLSNKDTVSITVLDYQGDRSDFALAELDNVPGDNDPGLLAAQGLVAGDFAYIPQGEDGILTVNIQDPNTPPKAESHLYTNGSPQQLTIVGDFVYIADGSEGLAIFEVTTPESPVHVEPSASIVGYPQFATDGSAQHVTVAGDFAYVADGSEGLAIFDISYPHYPEKFEDQTDTGGFAQQVAVAKDVAYVVNSDGRLASIKVDQPSNPHRSNSQIETDSSVNHIVIRDDFIYIADGYGGMAIVDINDPRSPTKIEPQINTDGFASHIAVDGDFAYLADREGGLAIVDISDPYNSKKLEPQIHTEGDAIRVFVEGNFAYTQIMREELPTWIAIDITDPNNAHTGTPVVNTNGKALHFTISNNYAYVANQHGGLAIIDIRDPLKPKKVGPQISTDGFADHVTIVDNFAYVVDGFRGFAIIDVHDPLNPVKIEPQINTKGTASHATIARNIAYVAASTRGLAIIDVSDPYKPKTLALVGTDGLAEHVAIVGDIAYVADGVGGLAIIDVHDPLNPAKIEPQINTNGYANHVTVAGDFAYVLDIRGGLTVVNVSDPFNPSKIEPQIEFEDKAEHVAIAGNFAYVPTNGFGPGNTPRTRLAIVDVTSPAKPGAHVFFSTASAINSVEIVGNIAYLATNAGIETIDVGNPKTPVHLSRFRVGPVSQLSVQGDTIYGMGSFGLVIVPNASISLSPNFVEEKAGSIVEYTVSWNSPYPGAEHIHCTTTDGACKVLSMDQIQQTASIAWQLPSTPGDYEIAIATRSRYRYYSIARDRLSVK